MNIAQNNKLARIDSASELSYFMLRCLDPATKTLSEFGLCIIIEGGEPNSILFPAQNLDACHTAMIARIWSRAKA